MFFINFYGWFRLVLQKKWVVTAGFWWCRWFRLVPSFSSYVPFDSLDTRENLWAVARAGLGLAIKYGTSFPPLAWVFTVGW